MGEKGAYFANKEEQFHVPIINLQIQLWIQQGAGDAFNAGFAVALTEKKILKMLLNLLVLQQAFLQQR